MAIETVARDPEAGLDDVPRARLARRRAGRVRRGGLDGHADDAPYREGARVPGRVHRRDGGRRLPALPLDDRPARARGGAPARVRRDHARPAAPLPHARVEPDAVRPERTGTRRRGSSGRSPSDGRSPAGVRDPRSRRPASRYGSRPRPAAQRPEGAVATPSSGCPVRAAPSRSSGGGPRPRRSGCRGSGTARDHGGRHRASTSGGARAWSSARAAHGEDVEATIRLRATSVRSACCSPTPR